MRFHLGTHETSWLARLDVPLFVTVDNYWHFPTSAVHAPETSR